MVKLRALVVLALAVRVMYGPTLVRISVSRRYPAPALVKNLYPLQAERCSVQQLLDRLGLGNFAPLIGAMALPYSNFLSKRLTRKLARQKALALVLSKTTSL